MKPICIYHGNCADGFGAAWCVYHATGDEYEFYPGVYQEPPPDCTGRHVLMVDFSYKRPVMVEIIAKALSVTVLDHHKTAEEELAPLFGEGLQGVFDMERSGAMIAWQHLHDAIPPILIEHIQDRDLWKFKLHGTREIQAAIFSYPYDFKTWDWLMLKADLDLLFTEGRAIERKHHKDVAELTGVVTRDMTIGGAVVPIANLPYTLASDVGHLLAEGRLFAGCYWDTPEGRVFSLRSHEGGADVSAIAKQYGGGGHEHASGFRVPFDQLEQFEA